MDDERTRLLYILREIYGRATWSHKTYEKDRELATNRSKRDKWVNVVLMALTTTGVLASIPLGTVWTSVVAAFLAFISTGFALYQISFTPELDIQQYRAAAKQLLLERDKMLLVIESAMNPNKNIDELRNEIQEVIERLNQIYSASPDTSSQAYKLATKGLKTNEELTFSVEEIDMLLPLELRIGASIAKKS